VTSHATVTTGPLDVAAHEKAVADPRAGAVVAFQGVVRDHDDGRTVTLLEYEAHPSAAEVLDAVAAEIGDVALVAAVSTAHRAAGFAICARLVDEVKSRLPVWKRQVFADGTEQWVNCP